MEHTGISIAVLGYIWYAGEVPVPGSYNRLKSKSMGISAAITIREEKQEDQGAVFRINEQAFGRKEEALLVNRLRGSTAFIPALSLVAVYENKLIGHILFTRIKITAAGQEEATALALAPLAVLPEYQKMGAGALLVEKGMAKAAQLGYSAVIVLGHAQYYPRFGFVPAEKWNISAPFEVPAASFMGKELFPHALDHITGVVTYAPEFEIN